MLAGWLAGWLVGWLVGWLAGWLAGWLQEFRIICLFNFYDRVAKL